MTDDLEIGGANSDGIDTYQNLCQAWPGHRFADQRKLIWIPQDPGAHTLRNVEFDHLDVLRLGSKSGPISSPQLADLPFSMIVPPS